MSDNIKLFDEEVTYREFLIETSSQVKLKVISLLPNNQSNSLSIVFVGGLSTIIESFHEIVFSLSKSFPFYFIETRDHASSHINGDVDFGIESSAEDVVAIIKHLGLKDRNYILMGYSMGATIITDCYSLLKSKPRQMVLFQPVPIFHYPKWGIAIIRFIIKIKAKPYHGIGKWYLRNFVINKKDDPEMVKISAKAMDSSDPYKLRKTAVAISEYEGWDKLRSIDVPVLILVASKDTMHNYNDIMKMISLLPNCKHKDLETNKRTHSEEAAQIVIEFINSNNGYV